MISAAQPCAADAVDLSSVWKPWETTLIATRPSTNPYLDTIVRVIYRHIGSDDSFSSYAYWDGDRTWRLACAFPKPGAWTWRTVANDPLDDGLHDRRGTVRVASATSGNPLYRHGCIRSSANGRYLVHADGTPFLWVGDTAWRAPEKATEFQWVAYLEDRARHGYSAIQICPFCTWENQPAINRAGEAPFEDDGCERLNPAYWRNIDRLVAMANDHGMIVMLAGLPGWQHYFTEESQAERRRAFVRQIVGRLHGRHVVFSPSADSKPLECLRTMAAEIREATSLHPITQHCNTTPATISRDLGSDYYYDDDCMTFSMYQSGHHGGNRTRVARRARELALVLYGRPARRRLPVINGEAFYEGDPRACHPLNGGTPVDTRRCAYASVLSGATSGFTNGVFGIWDWGMGRHGLAVRPDIALTRASAGHIGCMGRLLRGLPWWTLEPAPDLILNQSRAATRTMLFARDDAGTVGIAYLPDNPTVILSLSGFGGSLRARWFDPVEGVFSQAAIVPGSRDMVAFTPPISPLHRDWVLVVESLRSVDSVSS